MTNIKQLILTLVALFAISTGAWAENPKVKYALTTGQTITSGTTVDVKDGSDVVATITYGESGGNNFPTKAASGDSSLEGYTAFTEGNGTNGNKTGGTFYTIVPAYDGTIDVAVMLNADKAFYVEEDGTALEGYNGKTEASKYKGTYSFSVSAGKSYKFYSAGSKLGFYGFEYTYTAPAPAGTALTPDATRKVWTLDKMPAGNVELQVEYYPGMLVKPTNLVGGTLSVEGLGIGTTSFTAPGDWNRNITRLTSNHFEGFKSVTEEEAKAWPSVPATGLVALFYNYDETEQKWDMIYFQDGAFYDIYKGYVQQLATIYNLSKSDFSVFYTTGIQMPAGFEQDEQGNIYVKKDTKFTVIAKPAEGYHLVGWSDDATIKELEREFTMTDDDFTVTAQFSDEYDLAFEAANANTIESGKATVKVGDTDKTATLIQDGKLSVKSGQTVTLTAKQGYKFRSVEAKKAGVTLLPLTIGSYTIYYAEGDSWTDALQREENKDSGWQILNGNVAGPRGTLYDKNWQLVSGSSKIDPSNGYKFYT